MLEFRGNGKAYTCSGTTRRDFLRVGTLASVGLSLPEFLWARERGGIRLTLLLQLLFERLALGFRRLLNERVDVFSASNGIGLRGSGGFAGVSAQAERVTLENQQGNNQYGSQHENHTHASSIVGKRA